MRDQGLAAAPDGQVLGFAREHDRVLVSADTDFGTLLARTGMRTSSVVLIRRSGARRATELAKLLLANLGTVEEDLNAGAIVVVGDNELRVPPGCQSRRGAEHTQVTSAPR